MERTGRQRAGNMWHRLCVKCGSDGKEEVSFRRSFTEKNEDKMLIKCICGYTWTDDPLDTPEPEGVPETTGGHYGSHMTWGGSRRT